MKIKKSKQVLASLLILTMAFLGGVIWLIPEDEHPYSLGPLDLDDAIVRTVGEPDSHRVLYVFASADCMYCKKVHPELQRLGNIRIYTFALPGHSEQARLDASEAICSADRAAAWDRVMSGRRVLAPTSCEADGIVNRNRLAATKIGLSVTPSILRPDGRALVGYHSASEIEQWLNYGGSAKSKF